MAKAKKIKTNTNLIYILVALVTALLLIYVVNNYQEAKRARGAAPVTQTTGNGAPNGAHYNLNMIGKPKAMTVGQVEASDPKYNNGRRIFVNLTGKTTINLTEGNFGVIDYDGTDGKAEFSLPNPDVNCDGTTEYSVFVRAKGKPGGNAKIQSCYSEGGYEWCAVDFPDGVADINITRTKGKTYFENVSRDLLYIDYCPSFDETTGECSTAVQQVPLFGGPDTITQYFWDLDNNGVKLIQFRFYEGYETATGWQPTCYQ